MTEESQEQTVETPSEDTESYIKELRGEAKGYRLKLRESERRVEELEGKIQGLSQKETSDLERLTKENASLLSALREKDLTAKEMAIDHAIRDAAMQHDVIDSDVVARLIDHSLLDYEDGKVTGVDRAVKTLLKEKPFLVKSEPVQGAGGPPLDTPQGMQGALLSILKSEGRET